VILDAGLDLGKTAAQSLLLLQSSARLASLGYPLLLSSSNKTFLGFSWDSRSASAAKLRWPRRRSE